MDVVKNICLYLWKELLLITASMIFLLFLNDFNKELLSKFTEVDYLSILSYDNNKAWSFLIITALLIILSALRISDRWTQIRQRNLIGAEVIIDIIAIITMVILVVVLITFINNPILKAALTLFFAGVVYAKSA